ncbi:UvrD-helicase domain-containing protein [Clavibacter sp. MX14-G9D]|uniref:UvrD-helicase domain-containing protein n=1 Tax=Clavibacter sp. MX14-G9D TaxID=3064656 RepID=UPI00293E0F6C|nr:UvrD-helicase domain-containing protein [Clavibacter sp. MX14-G9D]
MRPQAVSSNAQDIAAATNEQILDYVRAGQHFRVEAGAGSGKTTSLIATLKSIQSDDSLDLKSGQQIACITFTNVAKAEILDRISSDPEFFVSTIHEFCWLLIQPFQQELMRLVQEGDWRADLEKSDIAEFTTQKIAYGRGYRRVTDSTVYLKHDDVPELTARLLQSKKLAAVLRSRFPIVFVDEYQDTNKVLMESVLSNCIAEGRGPLFGFFGDEWQQIHPNSVGRVESPLIKTIPKGTNFRSETAVVRALNNIRPALPQAVPPNTKDGTTTVFHTNLWSDGRVPGGHSLNDLRADLVDLAVTEVRTQVEHEGWNLNPSATKTLILTHKAIAARQGYVTIDSIFKYNDEYTKLENPVLRYLVRGVEAARESYIEGRLGATYEALGGQRPPVRSMREKQLARHALDKLMTVSRSGSIEAVLAQLANEPFSLPAPIADAVKSISAEATDSKRVEELRALMKVSYSEVVALKNFLDHHSPYETEHGVKGAQFENVIAIFGGGWNHYNWPSFLSYSFDPASIPEGKLKGFIRARNLFYVCASRPQKNLAILLTQPIDPHGISVLQQWFGEDNIKALAAPGRV